MSNTYTPTPRTRPVRRPQRARYDRPLMHQILDEALIGSLAIVIDGEPFVQPMIHARDGEDVILHGSSANRMLTAIENGARCCLSVSLIDGLILGRTIPDHSFQYRSLSIHGTAHPITDPAAKRQRMRVVFDHIIAKRWEHLPPVDDDYLSHVKVLVLPLKEVVAKVNDAGPDPGGADTVWSGVMPFSLRFGPLQPAPGPQPERRAGLGAYTRPQLGQ